jgi:hypothetical protein
MWQVSFQPFLSGEGGQKALGDGNSTFYHLTIFLVTFVIILMSPTDGTAFSKWH